MRTRAEQISLVEAIIRAYPSLYWFDCSECGDLVIGGTCSPHCRRCGLVF